ncbi:putative serine threonine protein kinase domain protein [Erysiphe necator]|uniref:Putative serine threonine protein kinase domain protein n=1 Tax=Uncinula necator TaxID=52586 RepID=A0A0B1P7M7_UNCNE|nr:putative serine threonine protein kinase domain protein [Erysiphe necator]
MKEYNRRYQNLKEHTEISPDLKIQLKNLLLYHVSKIQPELVHNCRNLSYDETFAQCLQWTSSKASKFTIHKQSDIICNFCQNFGHIDKVCRKKIKAKHNSSCLAQQLKPLSFKSNLDQTYQLDTAADCHISGNSKDFSTYSISSEPIGVAGGGQVISTGRGDLIFPTSDGKIDNLKGAICIPGEKAIILSTAQLEKQGYSIWWPPNYQDIKLIRPMVLYVLSSNVNQVDLSGNLRLINKIPPNSIQFIATGIQFLAIRDRKHKTSPFNRLALKDINLP